MAKDGSRCVKTMFQPDDGSRLLAVAYSDPAVRVLTPADPTRTAVALEEALQSNGRVNVVVAGKHTATAHPTDTVHEEQAYGLAIWPHLSDDGEPDITIVTRATPRLPSPLKRSRCFAETVDAVSGR